MCMHAFKQLNTDAQPHIEYVSLLPLGFLPLHIEMNVTCGISSSLSGLSIVMGKSGTLRKNAIRIIGNMIHLRYNV